MPVTPAEHLLGPCKPLRVRLQRRAEGQKLLASVPTSRSSGQIGTQRWRGLQHPLQMLLTFLSTVESCELSALIASSPGIAGPDVTVPSMRPPTAPPAGLPAVPTVVEPIGAPPVAVVDPDELAVPAELVPGVLAA